MPFIKNKYPWLPLHTKLKAYIALTRPFTILPAFIGGLLITLAPADITFDTVTTAIYVGVTLMLLQAVGQIVNQVVDVEIDREIKPYRPIPSGLVDRDEAMGIAWILAIIAVGRGFTVNTTFGILSLILLFMAVFYSMKPMVTRRHPVINLVWQATARGAIPVIMCYGVYGNIADAYIYTLFMFVWVLGWQGTKDINDAEADMKHGVKTIVNTYGVTTLKVLATASIIIIGVLALYTEKYIYLALVPLGLVGLLLFTRQVWFLENTVAWHVFYIGIALNALFIFVDNKYL